MSNPFRFFINHTVGLALGSGGAKGLAHVAVIEYLASMKIPVDMIAGSSIGAVIGALHACGTLGKFKEDMLRFSLRDLLSFMDPVVPRSGLIEGRGFVRFMERYIPKIAAIEDLEVPLSVLATDYVSGASVVLRKGNLIEALRASVSIPGVMVPVRTGGMVLIDGGVANPLPVNIVREMGAGITIAVNLHPRLRKRGPQLDADAIAAGTGLMTAGADPAGKEADRRNILSGRGWVRAMEQWLRPDGSKRKSDMPNIFEVIAGSVDIMEYVNTARLLEYNSPTVLIEPDVIDVQTLDFADAKRIMEEGRRACAAAQKTLERKVAAWV